MRIIIIVVSNLIAIICNYMDVYVFSFSFDGASLIYDEYLALYGRDGMMKALPFDNNKAKYSISLGIKKIGRLTSAK